MATNFTKQHGGFWNQCFAYQVYKACEHAIDNAVSPATSKGPTACKAIQTVMKASEIFPKSPHQTIKFEGLQVNHT